MSKNQTSRPSLFSHLPSPSSPPPPPPPLIPRWQSRPSFLRWWRLVRFLCASAIWPPCLFLAQIAWRNESRVAFQLMRLSKRHIRCARRVWIVQGGVYWVPRGLCVCLCVICTPQLSVWFFGVKAYCNVGLCFVGDELCSIVLNLIHELLLFLVNSKTIWFWDIFSFSWRAVDIIYTM